MVAQYLEPVEGNLHGDALEARWPLIGEVDLAVGIMGADAGRLGGRKQVGGQLAARPQRAIAQGDVERVADSAAIDHVLSTSE